MSEAIPSQEPSESPYESKKALASLEAAAFLDSISFPEDFDALQEADAEQMQTMREALQTQIKELSTDDNDEVLNENRFVVELLAQRLAVVDELLDTVSSEVRAKEKFDVMEQV